MSFVKTADMPQFEDYGKNPLDDEITSRAQVNAGSMADDDSLIGVLGGVIKRIKKVSLRSDKRVDVALENIRRSSTNPTVSSIGSTPEIFGYLFDAQTEKLVLGIPIPFDYHEGNIELHLGQILVNNENDGDAINWVSDYVVARDNRSGYANGSSKNTTGTASQVTASTTIGDGNGGGASSGMFYETVLEFDPSDPGGNANDFDSADGFHIYTDIYRGSLGGSGEVGGTLLTHAYLKYK
jgi:hypothetical protein